MSSSLLVHLRSVLGNAVEPLAGVTWRRMFGCDTAFVRDQIFGLIWKHGRIGLRLPDAEAAAELLGQPGAEPWAPGGERPMQHWVLVPEELHDDEDELARWAQRAHTLALAAPPKPDKAPRASKPAPKSKPAAKAKPAPKSKPAPARGAPRPVTRA
ncbi:MAG: TfoX/Sxy family protein [Polyangia bacterium]